MPRLLPVKLKRKYSSCLAILAAAVLISLMLPPEMYGQPPAALRSNEVHADGSITFRYRDTGAKRVEVSVESLQTPLEMRLADGVWSARTPPLRPETYWYCFIVDGHPQLDPLNGFVFPNYFFFNSNVTVHGALPRLWEFTDVPHGELHHHFFKSKIADGVPAGQGDYYVYTPPGYAAKGRSYPTLYLLHGYAQTAADWTAPGGANFILDNLIAQRKAEPMIVVMPLSYGRVDAASKTLLTEIMPEVESRYRVIKRRNARAVAGLSLGGMESLDVAFNHTDLFAWVGSFSGGDLVHFTHPPPATAHAADFRLLWISCGIDDDLLAANRELIAKLRASDFSVTAVETPGAHTWMVWHDNFIHFVPLLFHSNVPQ